jgi:hypothetical protein
LKDKLAFNAIRSVRFHYHRFLGFLAIVSSGIRSRGPVDAISVPADAIAAGNPCRIIRELTAQEVAL